MDNKPLDAVDKEILFNITAIDTVFYNDMWNLLIHLAAPMNGLPAAGRTVQLEGVTKRGMNKIKKILKMKKDVHIQECLDILRKNL